MIAFLRRLFRRKPRPVLRVLVLNCNCIGCGDRLVWRGPMGLPVELACPCGTTTRVAVHPETGAVLGLSVRANPQGE